MLSGDELWEKCKEGGPITPDELGLKTLGADGTYYTEGPKE